jgi:hypothetical protein
LGGGFSGDPIFAERLDRRLTFSPRVVDNAVHPALQ